MPDKRPGHRPDKACRLPPGTVIAVAKDPGSAPTLDSGISADLLLGIAVGFWPRRRGLSRAL